MAKKNTNGIIRKDVAKHDEQEVLGTLDDADDAAQAFLNRWEDEETPSSDEGKEKVIEEEVEDEIEESEEEEIEESEDEEVEEESEEEDEDEAEDEPEEEEETPKKASKVLEDESEVEIKIDDVVTKVPVKDLKRLFGMEASLTKKSQQVAAQRKEVEAQTVKYAANLDHLYKRAEAAYAPYANIDMLVASRELDTEAFAALRKEAQAAYNEYQYVSQEAQTFVQQAEVQRAETVKVAAAAAIEVLKSKTDWSEELYGKIRTYASENGISRELFNQVVDPHAILLMNKARLYDESKKIVMKRKVKTPTKVIRVGKTTGSDVATDKTLVALSKLKRTGDTDDAADAFMARWQ